MTATADAPIWTPSPERIAATRLDGFRRLVQRRRGLDLPDYDALWRWSVADVAGFWQELRAFVDPIDEGDASIVVDDPARLPGARWFPGLRLNFAENLLRDFGDDEATAIVFAGEQMIARGERVVMTRSALRAEAAAFAAALRAEGVGPGDRVVGFMPNLPETVVAMLGTTSVGAIWSSCSPDFGVSGVLDRFRGIEPKVVVAADGVFYGGRRHDGREKLAGILAALPGSPRAVLVPYAAERDSVADVPGAVRWEAFLAPHRGAAPRYERMPFDHPLYVMYSSGTTGLPKCIVQSAGGILLNQQKELRLHTDLHPGDVLFYYTTCGWMMWNWLVAGLGAGATIALFDGSPFQPDASSLWRFAESAGVTAFGGSAKYFAALEQAGATPGASFDLAALRTVLSTGSPLAEESFDWIYRAVKEDVLLASISGGTDLNGCFVGGNPTGAVWRGEIQCRCLGMAVEAFDEAGRPLHGRTGELVCTRAFPSMPIFFWGDEDGSAYRRAYFERFPGAWHHGDFIEINERGGVRIHGRSDATLNPGGVRIGTAEIYRQVETLPEIEDSVVIGQRWGDDVRVVLFVKPRAGVVLDDALRRRIRDAIRANCSPRHVPAKILDVDDVPYTISMKKVEIAVRDVVHGRPVANRDALRNPEALDQFRDRPELAEP